MPQRRVHLVRHGLPLVDTEAAASQWVLDPAAELAIRALRDSGRLPADARWYSSPEPKARATAALLTDARVDVVPDLREQVRLHVGWIDDFDAVLAAAFARPARAAYDGWEPLAATEQRVTTAVRTLLARDPARDVVLVGHGTALALVAAELSGTPVDPRFPAAMGFPDVVTIAMPKPSVFRPLRTRTALLLAAVLTAVEFIVWRETGVVGRVLGPAAVASVAVTILQRTRELGISLLATVLISGFLETLLLLGWPRLGS